MVAEGKGAFRADVTAQYIAMQGSLYEKNDVEYFRELPGFGAKECSKVTVAGAALSPRTVAECLYMDVGRWGGSGPEKNGNAQYHPRRREFGVVCGNVAVLCHYPESPRTNRAGDVERMSREKESLAAMELPVYKTKVKPFLDYLSGQGSSGKWELGDVQVINALSCSSQWTEKGPPKEDVVHVFLGDLHLPVMTERERTYLYLDNAPAQPPSTLVGPKVPRCGRLDLGPDAMRVINEVAAKIAPPEDPPTGVQRVAKKARAVGTAIRTGLKWVACHAAPLPCLGRVTVDVVAEAAFLRKLWEQQRLKEHECSCDLEKVWTEGMDNAPLVMSKADAETWRNWYLGTRGQQKGAEIFEGAGPDLCAWLERLAAYQPTSGQPRAELVQLGDMYDFWIGLKCGVTEAKSWYVKRFVEFWKNETRRAGMSSRGNPIELLEGTKAGLKPHLLCGNHDNYLKYTGDNRQDAYEKADYSLWAEHGHAADQFNCEETALLGWALTQLAFAIPRIRDLEDPVAALVARSLGSRGRRLTWMAWAADVCFKNKRAIYVMGHTHQSMLKRITLRDCAFE